MLPYCGPRNVKDLFRHKRTEAYFQMVALSTKLFPAREYLPFLLGPLLVAWTMFFSFLDLLPLDCLEDPPPVCAPEHISTWIPLSHLPCCHPCRPSHGAAAAASPWAPASRRPSQLLPLGTLRLGSPPAPRKSAPSSLLACSETFHVFVGLDPELLMIF